MFFCFILGFSPTGESVFLRDIWPSRLELQEIERQYVLPAMFKETYAKITQGNKNWNSLQASQSQLYQWNKLSTYIKSPPFFEEMTLEVPSISPIVDANVLLNLGDSVTTGKYSSFFFFLHIRTCLEVYFQLNDSVTIYAPIQFPVII